MPELCRFNNIILKMLYKDNEKHHKPHFHARYGEYEASIGIDGEILAGRMPAKQLKLIQAWAILREEVLYEAWTNAVQGKPFNKIEPLH